MLTADHTAQALHWSCVAFMMSATVSGFLLGASLPSRVTQLLHPMITTAVCANCGAALLGHLTGAGYVGTLHSYLSKARPLSRGQGGAAVTVRIPAQAAGCMLQGLAPFSCLLSQGPRCAVWGLPLAGDAHRSCAELGWLARGVRTDQPRHSCAVCW